MRPELIAYAFRSGHIGFTQTSDGLYQAGVPDGALIIARGPAKIVGSCVRGLARLAYDNETYLIPGCPEADDDEQAYQAFMRFYERVNASIKRRAQK